jgi:superfamily I DNA/RNA helicase
LRDWLSNEPQTRGFAFALFPAVALPDSRVAGNIRPDCPGDIFIDITHMDTLESRVRAIFKYWQRHADKRNQTMGGKNAVEALIALLVPTRTLHPRIADIFEQERRVIEKLTEQQFKVLRMLRIQKRAAIVGGAGTGKTMLAMEKCQQLLDADLRVLFLCFNQNLRQWVETGLKHPQVMVATFHSMVGSVMQWAGVRKPPGDFFEKSPEILLDAVNALHTQGSDKLFDAIIVDEAQDFQDTWWIPLPDLLKDPAGGVLYVFFDDNQRIYTQISNIPMSGEPLLLSDNCRNTQHIHKSLGAYMQDRYETICDGPEGRPIEVLSADSPTAARKALQSLLHRLVNEEGVDAEDIVILTAASERRSQWGQNDRLGNFTLSWQFHDSLPNAIRVSSIHSYKGLESAVVILTELDLASREETRDSLIYVGLSRARHHVVVIGNLPPPTEHTTDEER